jgi:hypothetical protein
LFNANRMKLGVFGPNVSNGCAMTLPPGHLETSWAETCAIAQLADGAGIKALVPVAERAGVVAEPERRSAIGIDGCVVSWVNYRTGPRQWIDEVMPLMEQAGLRQPFRSAAAPVAGEEAAG